MRRCLTAAATIFLAIGSAFLAMGYAQALPAGSKDLPSRNPLIEARICYFTSGWNGEGLYNCRDRWRCGKGWHGKHRYDEDVPSLDKCKRPRKKR